MENKKNNTDDEVFAITDEGNSDEEVCCIGDGKIEGTVLASFSFNDEAESTDKKDTEPSEESSNTKSLIPFERIVRNEFLSGNHLSRNNNGAACIINGESADIKKNYMLRESTVRKLSELRSIHPNVNVCLSTIVDLAIETYYKCVKEL